MGNINIQPDNMNLADVPQSVDISAPLITVGGKLLPADNDVPPEVHPVVS